MDHYSLNPAFLRSLPVPSIRSRRRRGDLPELRRLSRERSCGAADDDRARPFGDGLRFLAPCGGGTDRSGLLRRSCHEIPYSRNFYTVKILLDGRA